MDNQRSPLLSWPHSYQGKGMEELRQALVSASKELETTRAAAQGEIRKREEQLTHIKHILNKVMRERDEALEKFQKLLLEKLLIQQQQQTTPGASTIEDEQTRKHGIDNFPSSDCEESIVSSPTNDFPESALRLIASEKPLPEKGKLLEAVMKAGPLLQTLLLAGPLPQWRQPPPPSESAEIPPVGIPAIISPEVFHQEEFLNNGGPNCGRVNNRKRGYFESDCDHSCCEGGNKFQMLLLH